VAEKPRDAVVKFDTYRNVQRHRAVLPAIVRHLVAYVMVFRNATMVTIGINAGLAASQWEWGFRAFG